MNEIFARLRISLFMLLAAMLATAVLAAAPEVPPGHAMYIVVLHDVTTMPHPADEPRPKQRPELRLEDLGGRIVESNGNNVVITLPEQAFDRVAEDPRVQYVQKVWAGEQRPPHRNHSAAATGLRTAADSTQSTDSDGRVSWSSGEYAYDPSGNIKAIGGDWYRYDTAGRLISTQLNTVVEKYSYDGYANLTGRTTGGTNRPFPAIDPGSNRVSGATYDVSGNMTSYGSASFQYDALNMPKMIDPAGAPPVRFIYTADDERIGIQQSDGWTRWRVRDFEGRVIREFKGSTMNTWQWDEDYVYANGRLVSGERATTSPTFTQYHTDHLGSIRLITNHNGTKFASKEYYPFGDEQTPVAEEVGNFNYERGSPMKFTGHERDYFWMLRDSSASEYLDYMHAREYNPMMGRFLSVDPVLNIERALRKPQGWNRYAYVENNPINARDPDGRAIETLWDIANIGIGLVSLHHNLREGNWGAAAVDTGGLIVDAAATAVPFIPGGAASGLKAARLAENLAAGRAFEGAVLDALGAAKNTSGVTDIASRVTTIPDLAIGSRFGVTELKNVKDLSSSSQLRAQYSAAKTGGLPFNLIVSTRTNVVSRSVQEMVSLTGGKIFIFDPKTKKFMEAMFDGSKIVR